MFYEGVVGVWVFTRVLCFVRVVRFFREFVLFIVFVDLRYASLWFLFCKGGN